MCKKGASVNGGEAKTDMRQRANPDAEQHLRLQGGRVEAAGSEAY